MHDHTSPSPLRRRMALLAAAILTATAAGTTVLAAPARAAEVCLVNGLPAVVVDGTIHGTPGNDTITCADSIGADAIDAGAGDDIINVLTLFSDQTINGGDGNDTIRITDPVSGTGGTINGGAGNDTIFPGNVWSSGVVNGDDGTDTITFQGDQGRIDGGNDADNISGNEVQRAYPGAGDGTVVGGSGDDILAVTDVHTGGNVEGGPGKDTLKVNGMTGGSLRAEDGNDLIEGRTQTNVVIPYFSRNRAFVSGGSGFDTCRTDPAGFGASCEAS